MADGDAGTTTTTSTSAGDAGGDKGQQGAGGTTTPPPGGQQQQQGGTTEQGQGKTQGGDDKGKSPPPPAEFEPKLPDGVEVDKGVIDQLKALAKEAGWKGEHAQKALDLHLNVQKAWLEKAQAAWKQQQEQWKADLAKDPDFGGAKLEASKAVVAKSMTRFASKELTEVLTSSGLIDHPAIQKHFLNVGNAIAEDRVKGAGSNGANGQLSEEESLRAQYPSMYPAQT